MRSSAAPSFHGSASITPVEPRWPGEIFVCLGSGPSLTQADINHCRGRARVIAINDTYKLAPWADVLYCPDAPWWQAQSHVAVADLPPLLFTLDALALAHRPTLTCLQRGPQQGLSLERHRLARGAHGGYQAINLAVHLGPPRQIILLGYDCMAGSRGEVHTRLLGPEPPNRHRRSDRYQYWLGHYHTLVAPLAALHIQIVNCSRCTAITAFPRRALADVLA